MDIKYWSIFLPKKSIQKLNFFDGGCLFATLLFFGFCPSGFSQLRLYKEHGVEKISSIDQFLEKNNFDYAIAARSTSPWLAADKMFSCLVKQDNSWYLVQISEPASFISIDDRLRVRPIIKQKKLIQEQADSLLKLIKPDEGMKYSQEELSALPSTCESVYRGKKGTFGGVSDAATYHLVEKSDEGIVSLSFYAPDTYLTKCLPLNPDFKILTGMVNTFQTLNSIASSMLH